MWSNGSCKAWLQYGDEHIQGVAKTVNGPMLHDLAKSVGYQDMQCVEMLRRGVTLLTHQQSVQHSDHMCTFLFPRSTIVWQA